MFKKIFFTILGIILIYSAVAFAIKAGIGIMPVDAAIATVAAVLNIKVGTISMLFHGSFFIGQLLMEKNNFRKTEFLQLLYITLGGSVLNFFLYIVLQNISFHFYPVRLLVCVLAFFVSAFGCTLVLETHLMRTPMEGCIQMLADRSRSGITMGRLRQIIDILLVVLAVVLTLIFGTDWTLREGTVIAALIFGPAMDFWKKTVFSKIKI